MFVFVFVTCSMMNFIRVFEWILLSRRSIGDRVKKIVFYEFLELLKMWHYALFLLFLLTQPL